MTRRANLRASRGFAIQRLIRRLVLVLAISPNAGENFRDFYAGRKRERSRVKRPRERFRVADRETSMPTRIKLSPRELARDARRVCVLFHSYD